MTKSINDSLYPEHNTVLKTAHDWQEYIKRYKLRNGSRLPVAIAVPTKDFLDLINNFEQVSKSNRSRREHAISVLAKAHSTERSSRQVPPGHFLWWVTTHAPNAYNALLAEYHDFCKQQSEKAGTL